MGPQLTVLIIEVSLFQSVHNSRFDCTCIRGSNADPKMYMYMWKINQIQYTVHVF